MVTAYGEKIVFNSKEVRDNSLFTKICVTNTPETQSWLLQLPCSSAEIASWIFLVIEQRKSILKCIVDYMSKAVTILLVTSVTQCNQVLDLQHSNFSTSLQFSFINQLLQTNLQLIFLRNLLQSNDVSIIGEFLYVPWRLVAVSIEITMKYLWVFSHVWQCLLLPLF